MKVLPVILSCLKNKHLWSNLLDINPDCIIFCGDKLQTDFILEDRILYLNCDDNYEGLPEKIICMINAILNIEQFSNITHIIKIDDHDTNISNLIFNLQLMQDIIEKNDYLGQRISYAQCNCDWHFNKCSPTSKWYNIPYYGNCKPWVDGGCGYILSINAIKLINSKYNPSNLQIVSDLHIYEDVMIGLILYEFNIHPVKIDNVIIGDK